MENKAAGKRLRCGIVMSKGGTGALLRQVGTCLQQHGISIEWLTPPLPEKLASTQFVLLRNKTPHALAWAKRQQQRNITVIPDPYSIERVKDRWLCRGMLAQTGVRLPEAIWGTPRDILDAPVFSLLPVILKQRHVHGDPVQMIQTQPHLLHSLRYFSPQAELIVECCIPGNHCTAYFIDTEVFVLAKQPFLGDCSEMHRLCSPSANLLESVKRYQEATGLGFGKADFVQSSDGQVYCVDGGVFPAFRNIPEASVLLARYLISSIAPP